MTDVESTIVTGSYRSPVTAEKRDDGRVILRSRNSLIVLHPEDVERLATFVLNKPHIQRYGPAE
jgi:hypothetical protein